MAEHYKYSEQEVVTELKTFQDKNEGHLSQEQELCNEEAAQNVNKQENLQGGNSLETTDNYLNRPGPTNVTTCSTNTRSKNDELTVSSSFKKVTETYRDETIPQNHGSPILPKPNHRTRKKSRVEFRLSPRDKYGKAVSKYSSLEKLNEETNIKQGSPRHQRKARRSFSGPSSIRKIRVERFSVGANSRPKSLSRDNISQPMPLVPEDCISQNVQKAPENKFFVELDELDMPERTWRETTRWIKYEEHVQPCGTWSHPRIPFVEFEGFFTLKDYLHEGLIFLEFMPDGLLDFSHTLATTITMCNRIKPKYRLKLQQIIYFLVQHQGDTRRRLHIKKLHREIVEKNEADRRTELLKRAFETSCDRVRNLWVKLSTKALMYSKLSAGYGDHDDDDMDFDEALINIPNSENGKEVKDSWNDGKYLLRIPEDNCTVAISECSDIKPDRYPLSANQEHLLKALSIDCQGVAIKFASLDFLTEFESFAVLVRLTNGTELCDFLEVPINCKFVFLLCSSSNGSRQRDLQACRAFGSLMTDKVFQRDLVLARRKHDIIVSVDKYVKDSVLFPPGQWDLDFLKPATEEITQLSARRHETRSLTMKSPPRQRKKSHFVKEPLTSVTENNPSRKVSSLSLPIRRDTMATTDDILSFVREYHEAPSPSTVYSPLLSMHPLETDGRWFGGLRREMARRYPLYWSDIKDAFHIQCLAAFLFVTFGVIALAITFGKLLLKYTNGYMGDSEMLLATSFSCMLMSLVGTEPHTVIGGTAAMVIIETVIYKAAALVDIHYLTWRLWIGLWIAIILLLILAFEKTYWITYCTRFTEEILHSMVAILFVVEAFKDIYKVFYQHPLRDSYIVFINMYQNGTNNTNNNSSSNPAGAIERPNTALLHSIILFSTFGIAVGMRLFQETRYFSPPIRRLLNFFSIPLAVNIMYMVSKLVNVHLDTIKIKHGIKLSSPEIRSWLINPSLSGKGSLGWGMSVLAVFPAFFVVIVIFIESEITALMCYKEIVSRKGSGFHGNLLVVAISVVVCSLLGLPWMCLAAVETSNHIDSLRVWTSYNIPGIKSHVEQIRQQRATLFFIGLTCGVFLYLPFSYGHFPIAVLSGLTLYMGVVATFGVQFFKRVELMFMAPSQHPFIEYLTNVPLIKVHLFTVIQIIMIALLMVIKSTESISFIFPIFIMLMIPIRVLLGKYVFSPEEMEQLDNEAEDHHQ